MRSEQYGSASGRRDTIRSGDGFGTRIALRLAFSLPLLATGCLSPYAKHSAALAAATAPVVEQAAAAYSSANALHAMRTDYDAIAQFDAPGTVYNPRTVPPLLSEAAIKSRLDVLAAFQAYVQSLVAISSGTDSPELQEAAKSVGNGLSSVGNTLAPSVESAFGIASDSSSSVADPITPTIQNGITTAVDALAQFLTSRRIKKELPPIIIAMDAHVKLLCDLLKSDIEILRGIELRDSNFMINQQTLFLREAQDGNGKVKLDPGVRRVMITELAGEARQHQASDRQLTQLSAAIGRLELTHHALAVEAQGNNPASIKQKMAELEAAAAGLGKFYLSL
jgi:hypothetical protein